MLRASVMCSAATFASPRPPITSGLRWCIESHADLIVRRVPAARRHEAGIKRRQIGLAWRSYVVVVADFVPGHVHHFARNHLSRQLVDPQSNALAGLQSLHIDIVDQ